MSKVMNKGLRCLFSGLAGVGVILLMMWILPANIMSLIFLCLGGWYFGGKVGDWMDSAYNELGVLKVDDRDANGGLPAGDFEWNDGYYLEGMDRCHNIQNIINDQLLYHPAVIKAEQYDKIDKAIDLIGQVYQSIGTMQYHEGEKDD